MQIHAFPYLEYFVPQFWRRRVSRVAEPEDGFARPLPPFPESPICLSFSPAFLHMPVCLSSLPPSARLVPPALSTCLSISSASHLFFLSLYLFCFSLPISVTNPLSLSTSLSLFKQFIALNFNGVVSHPNTTASVRACVRERPARTELPAKKCVIERLSGNGRLLSPEGQATRERKQR